MKVLVDTSIWSMALRRQPQNLAPWQQDAVRELSGLIQDGRVVLAGAVRQELLSGVAVSSKFQALASSLRAFPDDPVTLAEWERAAVISNACRAKGIAGSAIDFLLCAIAAERGLELFTADADFGRCREAAGIRLFGGGVWGQ